MSKYKSSGVARDKRRRCPRSDKNPYDRELYALQVWSKLPESQKITNQVYRCVCGKFHIGRPKGKAYEQLQKLPGQRV